MAIYKGEVVDQTNVNIARGFVMDSQAKGVKIKIIYNDESGDATIVLYKGKLTEQQIQTIQTIEK